MFQGFISTQAKILEQFVEKIDPWASAEFFPGGQKHTICLKKTLKNIILYSKKSQKTYYSILAGRGMGGGQGPRLTRPSGRP